MSSFWICDGCQPHRYKQGFKHEQSATHHCAGSPCACGSCHPVRVVPTDQEYKTWMAKLGEYEIENLKWLKRKLEGHE